MLSVASSAQSLGGLAFDGVDDFVVLDAGLTDQLSQRRQLSVEARLTFNQLTGGGGIFSFRKAQGKSQSKVLELGTSDDGKHLVVTISGGPANARTAPGLELRPDREYLISVTFDGTQPDPARRTQLYVDGVAQPLTGGGSTPALTPKMSTNAPVYLGRSGDAYSAITLRELRIWKTALSAAAVVGHATDGMTAPLAEELTAYYDFNGPNPYARQHPAVLPDLQQNAFSGQLRNFDFASGNSNWVQASVMPVELTSFSATAAATANHLNWTVASELDFDYYGIERSTDGHAGWEEIDRVYPYGAAGDAAKQYGAVDASPAAAAYYRLRMVDLDGSIAYSDVVLQEREVTTAAALSVYPNPSYGPVSIELAVDEAVSLVVTDVSGRSVWQQQLPAGSAGHATLDAGLTPGVYLLTARSGGHRWNQRLVIR